MIIMGVGVVVFNQTCCFDRKVERRHLTSVCSYINCWSDMCIKVEDMAVGIGFWNKVTTMKAMAALLCAVFVTNAKGGW